MGTRASKEAEDVPEELTARKRSRGNRAKKISDGPATPSDQVHPELGDTEGNVQP